MIVEEAISNLPTPEFKIVKRNEPQSKNPNLPPQFFSALIVGSKNSGKSYAFTSLLKMFEENPIYDEFGNELPQRIILFSPTALNESNAVFKNLKNLKEEDIHLEYDDDTLEEILGGLKQQVDEVNDYNKYVKVLEKYNKTRQPLTDEEYRMLYLHNFMPSQPKTHTITFFIFDDLISDNKVFKNSRGSGLVKFLLKHRHLYSNIIITTQYINSIQPVIKNNIDLFCLFKYSNLKDIINKFYPNVSGVMTEEVFQEMYLHATAERFGFLSILSHNSLKGRIIIRKGFNINLYIK